MADSDSGTLSPFPGLSAQWEALDKDEMRAQPDRCRDFAAQALKAAEPLLAHDICRVGLGVEGSEPDLRGKDVALRQLYGLALARCGSTQLANSVLHGLYDEEARDEETLGLLARTYKDIWLRESNPERKREALLAAIDRYERAWALTGGYWTGINVATLLLVAGDVDRARRTARAVTEKCSSDAAKPEEYWAKATMGEAWLVLGDRAQADVWYRRAAGAARDNYADIASTRSNARLLLSRGPNADRWLDEVLPVPVVGVFSGHRVDEPGRPEPRFPNTEQETVAAAIRRYIEQNGIRIGYSSAACGSDILFLEALQALGRETNIVLPAPEEDFLRASVDLVPGADWVERFEKVKRKAASIVVVSDDAASDVTFTYANMVLLGVARMRARQLSGTLKAFAVWDGVTGLPGGTASAVSVWQQLGETVDAIHPARGEARRLGGADATRPDGAIGLLRFEAPAGQFSQRIVSLLFADVAGFSKLDHVAVPNFVRNYLGAIGALVDQCAEQPLIRNTWGDGLFFCFASPQAAAEFALRLCEMTQDTSWATHGLPEGLSIRVALHCGPAFEIIDPILKQPNYTGAHVNRAARIEPVTPPNNVYSSLPFAAIAECLRVPNFTCEYVGKLPLAKKYGEFRMFSVKRP